MRSEPTEIDGVPAERGLSRRELVRGGAITAGALALGPAWWEALARPAVRGATPYGPLGAPDANGIRLPEGFSSRVIARGAQPVAGTSYVFPIFPDGAATYRTGDGGWILVVNSEVPTPVPTANGAPVVGNPGEGGASAIRFDAGGNVVDAYRILSGTTSNCAGGKTPWRTWLSCEEFDEGRVWECDPRGREEARVRPALGVFKHEAACVDPDDGRVYMTEDEGDGGFYRFTPRRKGDLSKGKLEIAKVRDGRVRWADVPDPAAGRAPTREQVPGASRFKRGEGIWFDSGYVYFATTGDSRIWRYNTRNRRLLVLYDPDRITRDAPLRDADNLTVSRSGDIFVCEDDGGDDPLDICLITPPQRGRGSGRRPRRRVGRFCKFTGPQHGEPGTEASSEIAGVCFNPAGDRLYASSQRAFFSGVLYEVAGPFRKRAPRPRAT